MSKTGMCSSGNTNNGGPTRAIKKLPRNGEIVKKGYVKKMKTMRKKFFVLRAESRDAQACLEYYDAEKKFERNAQPKRSITLRACFNINRRTDTKYKHVIALYTRNDVFCMVLDNAEELEDWLQNLLFLENGEDLIEGDVPKPHFEHVWPVEMANRELGGNKKIVGPYLLCLTDQSIKLVKTGANIDTDRLDNVEFSIHSIRCCGDYQTFFYLEVGTATVTGPGNLWMQVEDNNIAANMHATVLKHCMSHSKANKNKEQQAKENSQYTSTTRIRSPSVSEISRPIGINSGTMYNHHQPYRTRTNSEGMQPLNQTLLRCSILDPNVGIQPHQFYKDVHHTQLLGSPVISPTSDSAGSSLSLDNVDNHVNDNCVVRSRNSLNDEYSTGGTTITSTADSYVMWNAEKRKEDERLNNYLTDNNLSLNHNSYQTRKISPNSFKSSSPSQASFLDVHSPCGSSPMEQAPTYFPMSPVSTNESKNRVLNGCLSVSHSRGSSITEDGFDQGYMDMTEINKKNNRRHHDTFGSIMSPGGSTGSMTSGTPSKDLNFPEYHLDRVSSFLTPAEEEPDTKDSRQKRAYSVGSRPENLKTKINKNENQESSSRTRAFSVGSKLGTKPRQLPVHSSSQSSIEHSEDMMELDFSHTKHGTSRTKKSSEKLGVPPGSSLSSAASSYSTAEGSSYLDSPRASPRMGSQPDLAPSPPRSTSLLQRTFGRSPPKSSVHHGSPPTSSFNYLFRHLGRVPETPPGYVEMKPSCKGEMILTQASSPPRSISIMSPSRETCSLTPVSPASTTSTLTNLTAYSPPKAQPFKIKTGTPPKFIDEDEEEPYMNMAPSSTLTQPTSHKSSADTRPSIDPTSEYMEMVLKRKMSVEEDNNNRTDVSEFRKPADRQSWCGNVKHARQSSLDESRTDDYMDMNPGHKKDRRKTQPITISSSCSSASSPLANSRKVSASTPPKAPLFLPLSNSSPARNTRRKSSLTRRESRESSTPTIFPFSLSSPAISPAEIESPSSSQRVSEPLESVREVADNTDYVNFTPESAAKKKKREKDTEKSNDYVEMQPPTSISNIAPPALATASQGKTLESVQRTLAILGLSTNKRNSSSTSSEPSPPPTKEITYESLDLESSSSSSSSLASRSFTSYATIDHAKTALNKTATASSSLDTSSPKKN